MSLTIVSGNLNISGNAGNFETDASTWGISLTTSDYLLGRSSRFAKLGTYACRNQTLRTTWASGKLHGVGGFVSVSPSKKYLCKAYVRCANAEALASATAVLRFESSLGELTDYRVQKSVGLATGGWTEIEGAFETTSQSGYYSFDIKVIDSGTDTVNQYGYLFIDNFRIYEVTEDVEPVPSIEIDIPNCIITDESTPGADDGSIEIAIIESDTTAPIEYSKNNGVNWQSSNQFTGLAPGVYQCKVRDSSTPAAEDAQSFSINESAPDFDFTTDITHETVSGASDGRIEVTVTGTGGPFTYSKNGGSTYQSSNIFTNLAPATYTIVVKDAGDNIIAYNATVNPGFAIFEKAYFDRDPIAFNLPETANSGEDNYKVFIDVRVEDDAGTGTYLSKMKAAIAPDTGGIARFNLRQAFRGVLSAIPPDQGDSSILKLTDRLKFFRVYYGDTYDDMTEPASYSTNNPFLVLLGGLAKRLFPQIDFFGDFLPTEKKFMTWAPDEKEVDLNQEDFLNFYIYDPDTTEININIKAYFSDNTNETETTLTKGGVAYGELYQLPAGPGNSGASGINVLKDLTRYELWLTDQADAVISEVRTYKITQFKHPNTRYLMILNSLGAYEVLRLTGQNEEGANTERSVIEMNLPVDYNYLDGQYATANMLKQLRFSWSTGMLAGLYGSDWLEYMQEILMSRKVYDVTAGIRIPVIVQSNSMVIRKDGENSKFLRFETVEAYGDHSYSPQSL